MDRKYTRPFFGWYGQQFQYQQERVFLEAFEAMWRIAVTVQPANFIAAEEDPRGGWRRARAKVLDNAVVGFCLAEGVQRA